LGRLAHRTHDKNRPSTTNQEDHDMQPIHIPEDSHDHDLLTFEQFCELIHTPPRTVRDWRRRDIGPRWSLFEGCGRLYVAVAEVRRFVSDAIASGRHAGRNAAEGRSA